ncbi:MAG: Panacea domain-containing protein [Hyphomicrobiaceae bacterium]
MANVFDVARYILARLGEQGVLPVTTWKLQKLVYYSQAWSAVWSDEPLFGERIEAWANGPVCPDLYAVHRGQFQISQLPEGRGDASVLTADERENINLVIGHYAPKAAQYLSELTHAERPWIVAREGLKPGERGSNEITVESMVEYYGSIADASGDEA